MTTEPNLEALLRATTLRSGRIAIDVTEDGQWRASIAHFNAHLISQAHPFGDPVEALRAALIEDERRSRDQVRRYDAAPKLGTHCTLGAGCETAGVCYADAHGEPERCGRPIPDDSDLPNCVICEDGGCDACRSSPADELMDLLG